MKQFGKVLIGYAALIATVLAILGGIIVFRVQEHLARRDESVLRRQLALLRPLLDPILDSERPDSSAPLVDDFADRAGLWVTIFDRSGRIVVSSGALRHEYEGLLGRPDFSGPGFSYDRRPNQTFAVLSSPIGQANEAHGFVRLASPATDYVACMSELKWTLFIGSSLIGVGALTLILVFARRSESRIERIAHNVEAIRDGGLTGSFRDKARDQIGSLSQSLEQMRRAVEERLTVIERDKNDLQTMLDTLPEGVVAVDANQRILFANPSMYRLFAVSPRNMSGQMLWEVFRHPGFRQAVAAAFSGRQQHSAELEVLNPPRILAFRSRMLTVESGRGLIIVLHDLTELRRLERIRQEFVANVSHELKTPLAAIKAYTETLLNNNVDDPEISRRFLHRIEEQADRLHALVIDMLLLARAESQDHGFVIQPIDLHHSVEKCLEQFRDEVEAKSLTAATRLAPDARWVRADNEGVLTILRNLIENAVKYTPDRGRIAVSTEVRGDTVAIQIADTGVGIPKTDLHRIFERFYRVDRARSRDLGGTGLGLSIVKHLVQLFGGSVSVSSRLNHGSTFVVCLPICRQTQEESDKLARNKSGLQTT